MVRLQKRGGGDALWALSVGGGLQSGQLHTTATDHCAFCAAQKAMGADNFAKIPNGTGGVEERMAVLWDAGVNSGRLTPSEWVSITSANAAKLFNIYPRKGCVAVGADADIAIWDPRIEQTLTHAMVNDGSDYTPYEGMRITGWPVTTLVRGQIVAHDGRIEARKGHGTYLKRDISQYA